ncbi:hypothetical protein IU439_06460 [Nocardia farcinica]|nr:hypothetical protein [Nocardia farcinica]
MFAGRRGNTDHSSYWIEIGESHAYYGGTEFDSDSHVPDDHPHDPRVPPPSVPEAVYRRLMEFWPLPSVQLDGDISDHDRAADLGHEFVHSITHAAFDRQDRSASMTIAPEGQERPAGTCTRQRTAALADVGAGKAISAPAPATLTFSRNSSPSSCH